MSKRTKSGAKFDITNLYKDLLESLAGMRV